jgi:hypothetical protein
MKDKDTLKVTYEKEYFFRMWNKQLITKICLDKSGIKTLKQKDLVKGNKI